MIMTEEQKHILDLILDRDTMRKIAKTHWILGLGVHDEAFLIIIDSPVVHSELGLDVVSGTGCLQEALDAFSRAGIRCHGEFGLLSVQLPSISFKVRVPEDGTVAVIAGRSAERTRLSPDSLVKLALFAEAVLPEMEERILKEEIEYDKVERVGMIASVSLAHILEDLGRPFKLVKQEDGRLLVQIQFSPTGKLSVSVPAEKVTEFTASLDETLRCAEYLYSRLGASVRISDLDFWDHWAERSGKQ